MDCWVYWPLRAAAQAHQAQAAAVALLKMMTVHLDRVAEQGGVRPDLGRPNTSEPVYSTSVSGRLLLTSVGLADAAAAFVHRWVSLAKNPARAAVVHSDMKLPTPGRQRPNGATNGWRLLRDQKLRFMSSVSGNRASVHG